MSIPYQKTYDRAVIQELVVWFRERFDRLPQRIQLRPGMVIPDVKVMVRNYLDVVQMHYENPTYARKCPPSLKCAIASWLRDLNKTRQG